MQQPTVENFKGSPGVPPVRAPAEPQASLAAHTSDPSGYTMGKGSPQYRCRANSQSRSLKLTWGPGEEE